MHEPGSILQLENNPISNGSLMGHSSKPLNIIKIARKSSSKSEALVHCCEALEATMVKVLEKADRKIPDRTSTDVHPYFRTLLNQLVQEKMIDFLIQRRIMEIYSLSNTALNYDVYVHWASEEYKKELKRIFDDINPIIDETESIIKTLLD